MSPSKTATIKKKKVVKSQETEDEGMPKSKKVVDVEDVGSSHPVLEEKVGDDVLIDNESDESDDELGMDDEDLNPFGDKWEQ